MMPGGSLRFRMMALFCVVVGVFLSGTYLFVYTAFAREVRAQLDRRLLEAANPMVADLAENPDEQDVFTLDLQNVYLVLVDAHGRVLNLSRNLQGKPFVAPVLPADNSEIGFTTISDPVHGRLRAAMLPFHLAGRPVGLAIAEPTRDVEVAIGNFRRTLLMLLPLSLVLIGGISAWYVGRSLRPVADLTQHAAQLTANVMAAPQRELQAPLPVPNPHDELGQLATTFNGLFASVNAASRQLRQFVSDASHQLRTPLSVLQGETELLLSQGRTPAEYVAALRIMESELRHLSRIVERLFTLSMADAGQLRLAEDEIFLDEVLEEACEIAAPIGRPKHISIQRELLQEVAFVGDEVFLRELFLIFLENAIKYSPAHTTVTVRLERHDGVVQIAIQDQGIGIADEHIPHIFERFYRVASTDAGETRSGGLGLAIAQAIVQAQGGSINCRTAPGSGSTFTITFPATNFQPQQQGALA